MQKNYFNSLIGYKAIKKETYRIIDQLNNPDKYAKFGIKEPHSFDGKFAPFYNEFGTFTL
jgi:ATP-dependent Zn protease